MGDLWKSVRSTRGRALCGRHHAGSLADRSRESEGILQAWFAAFCFSGNIVIGLGMSAIGPYWIRVIRALPELDLRVLNLS